MKRVTVAVLSLLVMAGLMIVLQAPNASAVTLTAPVSGVLLAGAGSAGFGDTVIASEFNVPFTTPNWSGLLSALVVRETVSGNLDFYYQITNNGTSGSAFSRATDYIFTGFTTDVYWRNDGVTFGTTAGFVKPDDADRNTANTVGFDFVEDDLLSPGQTSVWFFIATNAKAYTTGGTSLIDGGSTNVTTFQPIPLPPTALLLGTGLLGLVGLGYRRSRKS